MSASVTSALPGLLFAVGLAAFLIWDLRDDWRKGRLVLRGSTTIYRRKQPGQYYFGLVYKLIILALSVVLSGFWIGRMLSRW